jgi:hypothetical protein
VAKGNNHVRTMNQNPEAKPAPATEPWKTVLLYGDAESGSSAHHLLTRVATRSASSATWESDLWRFDVMQEKPVAAQALKQAQNADLIMLSANAIEEPPAWLMEWLDEWAVNRTVPDAAVAAWCRHAGDQPTAPGVEKLRQFARAHGLAFLCANDYRPPAAA